MKLRDLQIGTNTDATAPGLGYPQPTLSDVPAGNLPEPYRSLDVFAAGVVSFVGADGNTYTTPAIVEAWLPWRLDQVVLRVNATGTTVSAANLRGIL